MSELSVSSPAMARLFEEADLASVPLSSTCVSPAEFYLSRDVDLLAASVSW
jgi:hypothetical protein